MQERVSVIRGKQPVILVAPHGCDDTNTDIIAEVAANTIDCHAVINRGFERDDNVDVMRDKANCNRCDHVKQPVVYEEFLQPIEKIVNKFNQKYSKINPWWDRLASMDDMTTLILYIHGCGNDIHKIANTTVEVIVGYGLGNKEHSITCEDWRKELFLDFCRANTNESVCCGKGGGKFAGRDSNNMNQYFRKHSKNPHVESLQLEFPYSTRSTQYDAEETGRFLADVVLALLGTTYQPKYFSKKSEILV